MKRFVLAIALFAIFITPARARAGYGNGYENDNMAAAAFVDGTREYTFKFFDAMRAVLAKRLGDNRLAAFDAALTTVKLENAALASKIFELKLQGASMKADDPAFAHYHETLAKATDLMFFLMKQLPQSDSPPTR